MAGLYIHIPFCKKFCNYCDFYSITSLENKSDYIKALSKEVVLRRDYLSNESINTVYFGGGTPSLLTKDELLKILNTIKANFPCDAVTETTIEVNPDDVVPGYPEMLLELGFNRISLGVQSWNNKYLLLMNRRHSAEQAEKAINDCITAGYNNISIDLIYGIPQQTMEEWTYCLDKTMEINVQHLSVYHLTIEQGTIFGEMKRKRALTEVDEEISLAQYNLLLEKTGEAGFINYEISNFGKEGFFSKHNTNYWRQVPYIGLGPAAHSFNGFSRQWNIADMKKYINVLNSGKIPCEKEILDSKMRFNEYILTSLRTMWGINLEYLETKFDKETKDYVKNMAVKYIDYGMMVEKDGALVLTKQGIMISDNIISDFLRI